MSFRSAKLRRRSKSSFKSPQSQNTTSTNSTPAQADNSTALTSHPLIEPWTIPTTRRGYGTLGQGIPTPETLLVLPNRRVFTQVPSHTHHSTHYQESLGSLVQVPTDDNNIPEADNMDYTFFTSTAAESPELRQQRQRQKKERQWNKWASDVIPSLIKPHLVLLRRSESLRNLKHEYSVLPSSTDSCDCAMKKLKVVCVFFERSFYLFSLSLPSN